MALVAFFILIGSAILSLVVTWQVRHVSPEVGSLAIFYLKALPLLFLANLSLGVAFTRGHQILKNLPLLVAMQSFTYYLFLLLFAVVIIHDRVPAGRAVLGFLLLAAGVYVLKW